MDQGAADVGVRTRIDIGTVGRSELSGEVAHHAASERVARAGGVDDGFGGVCGEGGDAVAVDEDRAVLTLLDHDKSWAHVQDMAACGDGVGFAGQQLGFVVIKDEAIDAFEKRDKVRLGDVDPEVHRVGNGELALGKLVHEAELDGGGAISEEDDARVGESIGHFGRVFGENAKLGKERVARVHVGVVLATPGEGFGVRANFEATGINTGEAFEHGHVLVGEVAADSCDEPHRAIEAGGC